MNCVETQECGSSLYSCGGTRECPQDSKLTREFKHEFLLSSDPWFSITRAFEIKGTMELTRENSGGYIADWRDGSGSCCSTSDFKCEGSFSDGAEVTLKRIVYKGPVSSGDSRRCTITDTLHGILTVPAVDAGSATFKLMFGQGTYHKFYIIGAKWVVTQDITLTIDGGIDVSLYSGRTEMDAIPEKAHDGSAGTNVWISWNGGETSLPYDPNFQPIPGLQEIIVYPNPPSMGIPNDNDIRFYGFYDYGNIPGTESALAKADGGKDYWFAAWLRSCPFPIPVLPALAAARWSATWDHTDIDGSNVYFGGSELTENHPVSAISYDSTVLVSGSVNKINIIGTQLKFLFSYDSTGLVITNPQGATFHPISFV